MYSSQSVKTKIEQIHLDYLCSQFNLDRVNGTFEGGMIDLISKDQQTWFELKSRNWSRNGSILKSQQSWWSIDNEQIKRYEAKFTGEKQIIYLLSHTEPTLEQISGLGEKNIVFREIYVAPWDSYKTAKGLTRAKFWHIGLNGLLEEYEFEKIEVEKGELHIAKNISEQVQNTFISF